MRSEDLQLGAEAQDVVPPPEDVFDNASTDDRRPISDAPEDLNATDVESHLSRGLSAIMMEPPTPFCDNHVDDEPPLRQQLQLQQRQQQISQQQPKQRPPSGEVTRRKSDAASPLEERPVNQTVNLRDEELMNNVKADQFFVDFGDGNGNVGGVGGSTSSGFRVPPSLRRPRRKQPKETATVEPMRAPPAVARVTPVSQRDAG